MVISIMLFNPCEALLLIIAMKQQQKKTFVIHILHTINQELSPTFL